MLYFLHNGKCRVLSGTSLSTLRQELKDFLVSHKNPDIKGFLPSSVKKEEFSYRLDFSSMTEPFQLVVIARTRKGYRMAAASFASNGEFLGSSYPGEATGVLEAFRRWRDTFRSLAKDKRTAIKRVRVSRLLRGL